MRGEFAESFGMVATGCETSWAGFGDDGECQVPCPVSPLQSHRGVLLQLIFVSQPWVSQELLGTVGMRGTFCTDLATRE